MVPVRPEELLLPGHAEELPDLAVRRAALRRRLPRRRGRWPHATGSVSSGCTSRRTPARTPTSVRAAASTAPITRSSTTTEPASRWSRSSPSRCPAPGRARPEVARGYVTELRDILRTLGVSDVRMEQGSLRCDVNTSLNAPGEPWGIRTETKNVNSLRSVERAVRSEMIRQAAVLDAGQRVVQETRHFSETTGDTRPGRSKEEATDYRYFPEPDLVPLAPDAELGGAVARRAPGAACSPSGPHPESPRRECRGHAANGQRRGRRPGGRDRRGRSAGGRGAELVAGLSRPEGQRARRSNQPICAIDAGSGRAHRRTGRCRDVVGRARPPSRRRCAGYRRGRRRGRRRQGAAHRVRRERARRRRRRGDRRQSGHRREGAFREGGRGWPARRRGHEGNARSGGRCGRARAAARAARRWLRGRYVDCA